MAGFGFGSNGKNAVSKLAVSPPEVVTIVVNKNQIVQLIPPYKTPRAREIRDTVNLKVLNDDGTRIFYYDNMNTTWTNVHFNSTRAVPLLAAPPVEACEKANKILSACPAVAKVTITDADGAPLTLDQVKSIDFLPVEACADEEPEHDEVAEAVLALQEKNAQQEQDIDSLKGKLTRAENEIATMKNELAELKGVVTSLVASAPPKPSAEEVVEIKQEEVPASPATVVKPKEGRLARAAAAKKRKAAE